MFVYIHIYIYISRMNWLLWGRDIGESCRYRWLGHSSLLTASVELLIIAVKRPNTIQSCWIIDTWYIYKVAQWGPISHSVFVCFCLSISIFICTSIVFSSAFVSVVLVPGWLDPRAPGDTGGPIFHSVRREITQEYASPANLLIWKHFCTLSPIRNNAKHLRIILFVLPQK